MSETILALGGFLIFIVQGVIWYTIIQFYPDPDQSVEKTSNAPELEETSTGKQSIKVVSELEKPHYSIHDENEALKRQVANLKQKESQLTEDNENLNFKLKTSYLMHVIAKAEQADEFFEKEQKAWAAKHIDTIDSLELANKIIHEKMRVIDQLQDELSDSKKLTVVLDRQNTDFKITIGTLEDSIRKRESDWHSRTQKLKEKYDVLKLISANLEIENQKLLETNNRGKTVLEYLNLEIGPFLNITDKRKDKTMRFSQHIEILRDLSERLTKCYAAALSSLPEEGAFIKVQKNTKKLDGSKMKRWLKRRLFMGR